MRRRSTRIELLRREALQAETIAELMLLGEDDLAAQVVLCWHDRLFGDPSRHRRRCRSCACLSCRRPPLAAWWRSFEVWGLGRGATSYAALPVGKPFVELPAIGRQVRNLRDRLARETWLFENVGLCGVTNGRQVHLIVSHPLLTRELLQGRLQALGPKMVLADVPAAPTMELSPQMLALLGSMRRGLQPARFVVLPHQGC